MMAGFEETHPAIFIWTNSDERLLVKGFPINQLVTSGLLTRP